MRVHEVVERDGELWVPLCGSWRAREPRRSAPVPLLRGRLRADREVDGGRLTRVEGDPLHPVNRGATCRKPLGCPRPCTPPDRATHAALARVARRALPAPRRGAAIAGSPRRLRAIVARARPRRDRVLHLRPAADRGLLRRRQAREGLPGNQQPRLELAAVHVERGRGLRGRLRFRRAAPRLRRHRAGRLPAAAGNQRRCLPPDRVDADPPPPGGRAGDRGRSAADADGAVCGPPPGPPPGLRPAADERDVQRARADGLLDRAFISRRSEGIEEALAAAAAWPPERAAEACGVRRRRDRRRGTAVWPGRAGDGAVVDGREPVDASARSRTAR